MTRGTSITPGEGFAYGTEPTMPTIPPLMHQQSLDARLNELMSPQQTPRKPRRQSSQLRRQSSALQKSGLTPRSKTYAADVDVAVAMAHARKQALTAPKMRLYVDTKINPALQPALHALCKAKPADPVTWLAEALLRFRPPSEVAPEGTFAARAEEEALERARIQASIVAGASAGRDPSRPSLWVVSLPPGLSRAI
jgi:hypothetical protein